jgi:hypothetical protein
LADLRVNFDANVLHFEKSKKKKRFVPEKAAKVA